MPEMKRYDGFVRFVFYANGVDENSCDSAAAQRVAEASALLAHNGYDVAEQYAETKTKILGSNL